MLNAIIHILDSYSENQDLNLFNYKIGLSSAKKFNKNTKNFNSINNMLIN